MATQQPRQHVVVGSLSTANRLYLDGEIFNPDDSADVTPAQIAELVASGTLVTPAQYQQMVSAWALGGSMDVAAALQRLRGEREGFLQSAARIDALIAEIEEAGQPEQAEPVADGAGS